MTLWRTAYASVIGTSHVQTGAPCQDAGACRVIRANDGREVMLAVVSDGAGSAACSAESSMLAVQYFLDTFTPHVAADPTLQFFDRTLFESWLHDLRYKIAGLADQHSMDVREFACTFLAATLGPESTVCVQVGDGAIIGSGDEVGDYAWLTWPQHGEFANTTNFITDDDAFDAMEFEFIDRPINEIAVFSDGIERLVLDMGNRSVHSPALRPIFQWLATTEPSLEKTCPDPALEAFLGSARINERTDDDKTLVMGTRVVPQTEGSA